MDEKNKKVKKKEGKQDPRGYRVTGTPALCSVKLASGPIKFGDTRPGSLILRRL